MHCASIDNAKLIKFTDVRLQIHPNRSQLRQINQNFYMNFKRIALVAAVLTILGANPAKSQNLGDLLGGGLGNTLGNIIEGVFSSSNITLADLEGEWNATGPAVCFQGEGFLKKAGGVAAAAAVETKLAPYYEQYGLNNAELKINADGTFSLTCKMIKLSGNITQNADAQPGVFEFNFTALGMKLTSVTTYIEKTSKSMDVMFDATKFKKLLSTISQFSGITIVKTLSSILDSYDGMCVGFHFSGGKTTQTEESNGFSLGSILNGLGGNRDNSTTNGNNSKTDKNTNTSNGNSKNTQTGTENNNNSGTTGLDLLRGILGSGKKK